MMNIAANAYQVNDSLLAGGGSVKVDSLLSVMNLTSSYSQSDKLSSDRSVNILAQQSAKTLADVLAKIYANQSGEYFLGQSAKHFANLKRGEFTPFAKGDFSHLSKEVNYPHWQGLIVVTTRGGIEFLESIKKSGFVKCAIHHLRLWVIVGYSKNALAKSSVRIGVLNNILATHDAPSVFFCVSAYAHPLNAVLYRAYLVAAVEQPKGWLVSLMSSYANSAVVTTPEIGVSSGDSLQNIKEIIVMMATPTQTQFKFLFLSIKRSDTTAKPCRIAVTAPNENSARLMLARDYMLIFAGRLPTQEVAHA
ncbi:host cell division inhibitor Icd-like protein [Providencia alcalifaciens]